LPETKDYFHGEKVAFGTICQLIMENRPYKEIQKVLDFCIKVGLPVMLSELGIKDATPEKIKAVAEETAEKGAISHAEPFKLTAEIVYWAILAADATGRYYKNNL
jgi:glycerol dehydrogenase